MIINLININSKNQGENQKKSPYPENTVTATLWPDILEVYNVFYDLNNRAPRFGALNE